VKRQLLLVPFLLVLLSNNIFGQSTKYDWLHQDSWNLGFGFTYPRYISTNLNGEDIGNYGLFLSIQRNFTEHMGFRLQGNYLHIKDKYSTNTISIIESNILLGSLGLLYYFSPCEPVSPYAGFGAGGVDYKVKNSPVVADESKLDYELSAFMGAEWRIGENWKLKTELAYHTAASGHFDGVYGTTAGGLLGGRGDTYMTFDLGVLYYFGYGEKSHICEIYDGITAKVDYDKIEEIVKRYQVQPADVDYSRIEDIVKRYKSMSASTGNVPQENWVLIGINFDFNKATIKPESIPILYNTAEILLKNPDVKVAIQGHTDNIGSDRYNQKLSLQRAETVKNFLVAKGVAADRLTTVGYGKTKMIMDNKTEQGRGLNRRIELKIIK
jgi:outer membrane protein OmpA-like peptidoglycan-associated protein/opacity protein-like surface antigen